MKKTIILILVMINIWGISITTQATNGYWSSGYGPKSKSLAGACVAISLSVLCATHNPATLQALGERMEFGLAVFVPDRGFTANDDASPVGPPMGPASIPSGTYESENRFFLLPHFGYNMNLDEQSTLGLAIGGNGGMNTEYDAAIFRNFGNQAFPSTLATSPTGIDLMQMFIAINYARKLNSKHTFGIAPILAIQSLDVYGLEPFRPFSKHPQQVTGNGRDISYGGGLRLGWLGQLTEQLALGVSYQTQLWMQPFDDYKGLLAEEGDFDIPPNFDLGLAYQLTPSVTLLFHYQRIEYSEIKALSNNSEVIFTADKMGQLLGTDEGLGFGWDDMNVYKIGLQWQHSADLTFRFGFSLANEVFPQNQALFNVLAPATVTKHYSFGLTHRLNKQHEWSLSLNYMPTGEVQGTNPNTGPQTGKVEMDQWEIEWGWSLRF